jgi:hypothetical protein
MKLWDSQALTIQGASQRAPGGSKLRASGGERLVFGTDQGFPGINQSSYTAANPAVICLVLEMCACRVTDPVRFAPR